MVRYLLTLLLLFAALYFGCVAVVGLSSPENIYSPFVARYLDFISPLRAGTLHAAGWLLERFGYSVEYGGATRMGLKNANGVQMGLSCIGYGVMSFWTAFVVAGDVPWRRKLRWGLGGLLAIWVLNVLRVAVLLAVWHRYPQRAGGVDHHLLFNIVLYGCVLLLMYGYMEWNDRPGGPRDPIHRLKTVSE